MTSRSLLGAHRLKTYKNRIVTADKIRTKRIKEDTQLRKERRFQQYHKKRSIDAQEDKESLVDSDNNAEKKMDGKNLNENKQIAEEIEDEINNDTPLDKLANIVMEGVGEKRLKAVCIIRRLLSKVDPPIDDVIDSGVIPYLIDCVDPEESEALLMEAAWALTNVASGTSEQTAVVVRDGGVPRFIQLLQAESTAIREQVLWGLGNITGDSAQYRDLVIDFGIIESLHGIITDGNEALKVIRQAVWLLSNLCRHKDPVLNDDVIASMLPLFVDGFEKHNDEEVVKDLCWSVSYVTEHGSGQSVQAVLDCGILKHIIDLLDGDDYKNAHAALRVVGNITTGTDSQTQQIIDEGGLVKLKTLLKHDQAVMQKETCWAISNITAGTIDQKQAVINNEIIPILLDIINNGDNFMFKVVKEAIWAVSNITEGATQQQISYLVGVGIIQTLIGSLKLLDGDIIRVTLDGILGILTLSGVHGDKENTYASMIHETAEYVELIEELQSHANPSISEKATTILDTYIVPLDNDVIMGNKNLSNINNKLK